MKLYALAAAALTLCGAALASDIQHDARTLAGLEATPSAELQKQFTAVNKTWDRLKEGRIASIQAFAQKELATERAQCKTLFYPFSGPDILNAVTLFPDCPRYVLFGLEPVGALPDMAAQSPADVTKMLKAMGTAQDYLVRRNFFVTQYMGKDLRSPQLNGVLPLMSVMLVRMGYELRSIELRTADDQAFDGKGTAHGVTVTFGKPGGPAQRLFYGTFDASDAGLKARPELTRFYGELKPEVSMLKAASYLLHAKEFGTMKAAVLKTGLAVVQDDTGVPYKDLTGAGFAVGLYGHYKKPIPAFSYAYQADLSKAYAAQAKPVELPFAWSYNWDKAEVGLQLARRPQAPAQR